MGNIISKSGVGEKINYGEGTAGPNALTSIQNVETTYNPWPQTIGYNDFNKLSYMTDTINGGDSIQLSISYGFDNQRRKSTLSQPNAGDKTKYFFGDYEIITDDNGSKEFLFVNSPTGLCAIIENSNVSGTRKQKVWHTYTDHLGSLVYAVNADSTAEKREYSYDAWGNLRNHADWLDDDSDYDLIADRGYTGHEHLTEFGLINMNGRVYDPVVGRFLSVDPFVQKPGYVDGYNRYAYVLNNPLIYTDPTGYVYDRDYTLGLWGIKPQQDSGHGMVGGGTTMGSQISSAGGSNGSSSYKWGKGGYSWIGGNHYIDGNGNSASWQEAIEGTYQKLYGRSFFDNLNYVNRGSRKAKRLKISFPGGFKLIIGRGSLTQRWQYAHPHIDISLVTVNVVVPRVNMLTTDDPILHIMARVKYLQKHARLSHLNDIIVPNKYSNSNTGTSGAHYHKRFYNYHKRDNKFGHTIDVRIIPYSEFGARDKPYTYSVHDLGWGYIDYFTPIENRSPEYNDGFYMGFFIIGLEKCPILTISADNLDTYNYLRSLWKSIDF